MKLFAIIAGGVAALVALGAVLYVVLKTAASVTPTASSAAPASQGYRPAMTTGPASQPAASKSGYATQALNLTKEVATGCKDAAAIASLIPIPGLGAIACVFGGGAAVVKSGLA